MPRTGRRLTVNESGIELGAVCKRRKPANCCVVQNREETLPSPVADGSGFLSHYATFSGDSVMAGDSNILRSASLCPPPFIPFYIYTQKNDCKKEIRGRTLYWQIESEDFEYSDGV